METPITYLFGIENFTEYTATTNLNVLRNELVTNGPFELLDTPNGHVDIEPYPADTTKNAYMNQYVNNEDEDVLLYGIPAGKTHLYFQWKEYRSATFDFGTTKDIRFKCYRAGDVGGTLLDIYSGFGTEIGQNTTGIDNATKAGFYLQGGASYPQSTGDSATIQAVPFNFQRATEYTIEYELKLNTPNTSDGIARVWVNGSLIIEKLNGRFSADGLSQFYIDGFQFGMSATNGSAGSFAGVSKIYRTDFIVSEQPIP